MDAGKRDLVEITMEALDVAAISASVTHPSTGATSIFVGTTRDNFANKEVVRLEYEAYEGMARKQLASVCKELRARWPEIHSIAVHHRLGLVEVTQASVVIAISSPHRKDAIQVSPVLPPLPPGRGAVHRAPEGHRPHLEEGGVLGRAWGVEG